MKLQDLMEEKKKGTYAGVHFDEDTKNRVEKFIEDNKIPNPIPIKELHTTLLYSRKYLPDFKPRGKIGALVGKPTKFNIWVGEDKNNCLVLQYDCPQLEALHKKYMKEHEATFDYDKYNPHITLSYNVGDIDIKKLDPSTIGDIKIIEEFGSELDLDWAAENGTE